MYRMTETEFESAIEEALERIPSRFLKALENIEIVMQDEPDPEQLASLDDEFIWEYDEGEDEGEAFDETGLPFGANDGGEAGGALDDGEPGELFGLYEGIALTERDGDYGWCEVPDVITIFKGPHERAFDTREQVVEEIGKTVVHEIGHYFGLDDEKLYAMGY